MAFTVLFVGGFASVTFNDVGTATEASTRNGGTIEAPTVAVHALDDSLLDADSGGLAVALGGGRCALDLCQSDEFHGAGGHWRRNGQFDNGRSESDSHLQLRRRCRGRRVCAAGMLTGMGTYTQNKLNNGTQALIHDKAHVQRPAMSWSRPWTIPMWMRMRPGWPSAWALASAQSLGLNEVNSTVLAGIDDATVTANSGSITIDANAQPPLALALGGAGGGVHCRGGHHYFQCDSQFDRSLDQRRRS